MSDNGISVWHWVILCKRKVWSCITNCALWPVRALVLGTHCKHMWQYSWSNMLMHYVHWVCSHPIRLGNRLRGYSTSGCRGHEVNVIFTTVFRTLEEKNDWVLLLLTHRRLPPSWLLLFAFHHLPCTSISLSLQLNSKPSNLHMRSSRWICPAPCPAYIRSHPAAARNSLEEPGNEVLWYHQCNPVFSTLHSMYPSFHVPARGALWCLRFLWAPPHKMSQGHRGVHRRHSLM